MDGALTAIFQQTNALVLVAAGVFTRMAAVVFLLPGLGERGLPMRVRIGGALALTALLAPVIVALEGQAPETGIGLGLLVLAEALVGLIIGLGIRFLIFALQTAGMVAAQNLSVAQMFGSGVAPEPEPTIATLLSVTGIVLVLAAGLHVQIVAAMVALYDVFPFGTFPGGEAMAEWGVLRFAEAFALGVTLAAPFVVIGFAYNLALGALSRAMPQLLVAMIGAPFLLWIGFVAFYQVAPSIFDAWQLRADRVLFDPIGGFE